MKTIGLAAVILGISGAALADQKGVKHVFQAKVIDARSFRSKGRDANPNFKDMNKTTATAVIHVKDSGGGIDADVSHEFKKFNPQDGTDFETVDAGDACHKPSKAKNDPFAFPKSLQVTLGNDKPGQAVPGVSYDAQMWLDSDGNPVDKTTKKEKMTEAPKDPIGGDRKTSGSDKLDPKDKNKTPYNEYDFQTGAQSGFEIQVRIFEAACAIPDPPQPQETEPPRREEPKEQPRDYKFMINGVVGGVFGLYNEPHQFLGGVQAGYAVTPDGRGFIVFAPEVKVSEGLTTLSVPFGFQYQFATPLPNLYAYPRLTVGYAASFANGATFHYGVVTAAAGAGYLLAQRFFVGLEPVGFSLFFNGSGSSMVYRLAAFGGVRF